MLFAAVPISSFSHQESQLAEKEQTMEKWRKERDTLVAALEIRFKKLVSSQAEKDELIQQLQRNNTQLPQEVSVTPQHSQAASVWLLLTANRLMSSAYREEMLMRSDVVV